MFEDSGDRQSAVEGCGDELQQKRGEERSSAELKEIIVDADLRQAEKRLPDFGDSGLEGDLRARAARMSWPVLLAVRLSRVESAVALHSHPLPSQ